jgi:hypothetical protein
MQPKNYLWKRAASYDAGFGDLSFPYIIGKRLAAGDRPAFLKRSTGKNNHKTLKIMKRSALTKIRPSLEKASIEELEDIILAVRKMCAERVGSITGGLKRSKRDSCCTTKKVR